MNAIAPAQLSDAVTGGTEIGLPWQNACAAGQVITGGVGSSVHVAVRDVVDVLPQASIAVNVLVCERLHPLLDTLPSLDETVGLPHASVAEALPNAPFNAAADGLQPRLKLLPVAVIVGPVTSAVHVAVLDVVVVLPHASVAVNVLV